MNARNFVIDEVFFYVLSALVKSLKQGGEVNPLESPSTDEEIHTIIQIIYNSSMEFWIISNLKNTNSYT